MFITITIDTENPDAYGRLREHLESSPPDSDGAGLLYPTTVRITESAYEGLLPRQQWSAEYDPNGFDTD